MRIATEAAAAALAAKPQIARLRVERSALHLAHILEVQARRLRLGASGQGMDVPELAGEIQLHMLPEYAPEFHSHAEELAGIAAGEAFGDHRVLDKGIETPEQMGRG